MVQSDAERKMQINALTKWVQFVLSTEQNMVGEESSQEVMDLN